MKIAYIDHSFHEKTNSSRFLKEILSERHLVIDYWDESWRNGDPVDLQLVNDGIYDCVIFHQSIPRFQDVRKLHCENVVWIPMYDGERNRNIFEWLGYLICGVKVLSFSETLHRTIRRLGFDAMPVRYYPRPNFEERRNSDCPKLKIFFWERAETINWPLLKILVGESPVEEIVLRTAMDQKDSSPRPSREDIDRFNIRIVNGWLDKQEYERLFADCNLYVAPRQFEGIGMSFLEAMAKGIPVLAPDSPTMNEYIRDGENGFLYDLNNPKPVDFSALPRIRKNLEAEMARGFGRWQAQKSDIDGFIEKKPKKMRPLFQKSILGSIYLYYGAKKMLDLLQSKKSQKPMKSPEIGSST